MRDKLYPNPLVNERWEFRTFNTEVWSLLFYYVDTAMPLFHLPKSILIHLMNYQPQVKNQGEPLKVNQTRNHLTPTYEKFYGGSEQEEGE
ncbi:hypothetical protein PMIT1313_00709 [Prochlorococcus marinus str. MIT 1313]|nr:hypothetical protein PMIT1313_00709 [Prochlorococcus marinus str. MIT 1313]KZR72787.1 hypothetical protein PMIT1318_00749 [Prochlorococcus marinus str. MIT 1318]